MRINVDFSCCVIVTSDQHQWVSSPQGGVERMMLDRIGVEKARATSIVLNAPDLQFSHPGGEEILVLSGEVITAGQSCERGSWVRLPAGECPGIAAGAQGTVGSLKTGRLAAAAQEA